jgi:hypothetical protein
MKCELCSVSDKVTAMHPLYDFHGKGGRQICRKFKTRDGEQKYRLAWGHSICCCVLSKNGFLYGCDNNGNFEYDDSNGEDVMDTREPNPTSFLSEEFVNTLKQEGKKVNAYFRYFLKDESLSEQDIYRDSVSYAQKIVICF